MNTPTSPDTQEAAHLEKLRSQISTDIEAMHQKEASLKEYEQRLRLLVEHAQHSPPPSNASQYYVTSGPNSQASLDSEWEKYDRAHALLEAARRGLSDDRMALKDREERVTAREVEVARREAWLKVREQEVAVILQAQAAAAAIKAKPSFTTAPFLAAKNLFSPGKST
jgi:predicted  nucleic acid-binding Zn-ribbon protein